MWMRSFWNHHIDRLWFRKVTFHQIRGQIYWMFHLKTNNLEVIHAKNTNIKPSVSIHSMQFVFPFCPMHIGIPTSKNTWETDASFFSDFSLFLPLRVSYEKETHLGLTIWDFFNTKFTLGNVIQRSKSSLIDRGFAEFIFPRAAFIRELDTTCFCCKLNLTTNSSSGSIEYFNESQAILYDTCELPHLQMNEDYESILVIRGKDEYTFLSCGGPSYDPPDFLALFIPFTKTTWALIFMTIFGWPLVLSLIENDFNLKSVLKDFDALFIGWAMILEQSHLRATNYKGRGPLYCYCGCVLLAIFILSNAYKGDNIRALTKSFELLPLTHINHVINAGYKRYTSRLCGFYNDPFVCTTSEFHNGAQRHKNQYTDEKYKLWEPLGYVDLNIKTEADELNAVNF